MEEEPRRIRDVINLAHVLNFSTWDDDALLLSTTTSGVHQGQHNLDSSEGNTSVIITIVESPHPPPLDESYWTAKEQMVSTEQHVLRMIKFDTTVCHPHRCVLIIMDTLGFGKGSIATEEEDNDSEKHWLLTPDQSENVICRSWRIINEAPLHPFGEALKYPVTVLSCAAISLAAASVGESNDKSHNGKMTAVTLPDFWWRALDVSTKDITMARESLQKVCLQHGSTK